MITDDSPARGLTYGDFRRIAPEPKQTLVLEEVDREGFVGVLMEALVRLDQGASVK